MAVDFLAETERLLADRPDRAPDYLAENRTLLDLAKSHSADPPGILGRLTNQVLGLCGAQSAGVSVIDIDESGTEVFRWPAVAGEWSSYIGGTMPRHESPCAAVLKLDASLLIEEPADKFPEANIPEPLREVLLAPYHVRGRPVGTLWAAHHDRSRRFDAEDRRRLTSVAMFASLRIFAPPPFESPLAPDAAEAAMASLTHRQMEVLKRIVEGQPNKRIAADLGISKRTAENHRAVIMRKLGATSVQDLMRTALAV